MKFKSQHRQNQLIEKITSSHLVVGIDIAQQIHVARAVNFRGIIIGEPLSFNNDEDGFHCLLHWINKLQAAHHLNSAIVGMEPTGHYWLNISQWLVKHEFEVVLVNPHLVKKNKENRDNTRSKSDKKDALVIADMVKNGYYSTRRNTTEAFEELRVLLSNRDSVVKRLVSGLRKAQELIKLANHSVGAKHAVQAYKLHLKQLLAEYDLAFEQLQIVEKEILCALERIPFAKSMLAIKGISAISLAGILGEAGDLSGFVHGNALLRHAGLNLTEASSGKWSGQIVLSKRGRSRLHRFLFMATMSMVMTNPEFQAIHSYNIQTKKMKKMRSIMKLCGKLARILVGMARNGQDYIPHKTLSLQKAA